jgi:hypothetical protein
MAVWIGAGKLHGSLEILQSFVDMNRKRQVLAKRVIPDDLRSRLPLNLEVAVVLPSGPNRTLLEFFEPSGVRIQVELLQIIDKLLLILSRQCDRPIKGNRIDDHHFLRRRGPQGNIGIRRGNFLRVGRIRKASFYMLGQLRVNRRRS